MIDTSSDALDRDLTAFLDARQSVVRDPYPLYREMREHGPVYRHSSGVPFITTYAGAKAAFRDSEGLLTHRGKERFALETLSDDNRQRVKRIVEFEALQLSGMNGDAHGRVREFAMLAFTPARVAGLFDYAKSLANDMLEDIQRGSTGDWISLTYRLPLLVLMELLGAPREDADMLKALGDDIASVKQYVAGGVPSESIQRADEGIASMRAYAKRLAQKHRRSGDGAFLIESLVGAVDQGRISEDELIGTLVVVLYAGHLTTTDMLGNALYDLMLRRDQWDKLCADPGLAKWAVEESLRFNPPVQMMIRMPVRDTQIEGETIRAGTGVMVLYGSANRDPAVFPDPDRFDITRRRMDHMAFGHGIHFCLGSILARAEGLAVLDTISRRFPAVRLAAPVEDLEWNAHAMFHGLKSLPIDLGPDQGRTAH